jgi:hypothetical protein
MIPDFWLLPTAAVFNTVLLAILTGGNPAIEIHEHGIGFGIEYRKESP